MMQGIIASFIQIICTFFNDTYIFPYTTRSCPGIDMTLPGLCPGPLGLTMIMTIEQTFTYALKIYEK